MSKKYYVAPVFDAVVPRTTKQLMLLMVRPYKRRTFIFFTLVTLGIIAWAASPMVVAQIVTRLGNSPTVDEAIWWLVGIYTLLRLLDEVFWRTAEFLMRSFKPQL